MIGKNAIYLTKEGYETIEKLYSNFEETKKFMEFVLSPEEYDCWLFQNQHIKDTYFGDKPIYRLKSRQYSSKILYVDDIENKKHKQNKKDMQIYLDTIYERFKKEEE